MAKMKKRNVTFTVETDCERCGAKLKKSKTLCEADLHYGMGFSFTFNMDPTDLGLRYVSNSIETKAMFVCKSCQEKYEELVSKLSTERHKKIDGFFGG